MNFKKLLKKQFREMHIVDRAGGPILEELLCNNEAEISLLLQAAFAVQANVYLFGSKPHCTVRLTPNKCAWDISHSVIFVCFELCCTGYFYDFD